MPSIIAHCLCAELAINKTDSCRLGEIIRNNRRVFITGAQGPDPFFYYHYLPLQNKKDIRKVRELASSMHHILTGPLFDGLIDEVLERNSDIVTAYVAGFLCHHALDHHVHPYVYYRTEVYRPKGIRAHQLLESQMERGFLDHFSLSLDEYPAYRKIRLKKAEKQQISQAMVSMLKKVYNADLNQKNVESCYDDYVRIQRILFDVNGSKYRLISALENKLGKKGLATCLMVPKKYDDKMDAMNYRKDQWLHACNGTASNSDVLEMFNRAVEETVVKIRLLNDIIEGKSDRRQLLEMVWDRNFDTDSSTKQVNYMAEELLNVG